MLITFIPQSATEYHLGLLKAKLAKYRAQLLEPSKSAGAAKVRIHRLRD
jgi:ribosome-interacting GTPase 1